jgi:hypothetical protein
MTTHDHTQKSTVAPAKTRVVVKETAVPAPRGGEMTTEQLQRAYGNRATRLIIQRKMTVGPVGDKYEQEADAVAKQVVGKLNASPPKNAPAQTAQRQEEEELQMKPLVQRQEEEELQMKSIQRQEEEDELQMKPLPSISSLQRQEEEELQMKPLVQRQEEEEELQAKSETTTGDPMLAGGELSGDVESSVQSAKSGGQPMVDNIRAPMEQAFGADFSGVKVHTSGLSDRLNRSLSARAFTSGQDVFFRSGEYNPGSSSGQELLAHELTHVVQQSGSEIKRSSSPQIQIDHSIKPQSSVDKKEEIQRKISMKGSGSAKRTDGSLKQLWGEVNATVQGELYGEVLQDSVNIQTSITNRSDDRAVHSSNTDIANRHKYRINQEKLMRTEINQAQKEIEQKKK